MIEGQDITLENELIRLENEDVILNENIIKSLDKLVYQSSIETLRNETSEEIEIKFLEEYDNLGDIKLPLSLENNKSSELDKLENFLKALVEIRNKINNEKLITRAYENNSVDESLRKKRDELAIKQLQEFKNETVKRNKLQLLKKDNLNELNELRELTNKNLDLINLRKDISFRKAVKLNDYKDFEDLKIKYRELVKKNIMLSEFNTNLISALSNVDLSNDEKLLEILLDCGDYSSYDFFDDDINDI